MLYEVITPEMQMTEPGYPIFSPLTDKNRWELFIGKAAGERERVRVNQWLARKCPDVGETVVEAHPGIS